MGAGPAGSACAITAARAGVRVLLLDKDIFPRHKVCGEFVSPEAGQLLESLLGARRFEAAPTVPSARVFAGRKPISISISPAARSIARFDLDHELLQAARSAGVAVQEGVTVNEVSGNGDFTVMTAQHDFTGCAVVNASGRWSRITAHANEKDKDRWIGLKAHFREADPAPSVDLYFFDGGYCGVQPVGKDAVNACAMVRASAARSLDEVLSRHSELDRRSRDWQPLFAPISTSGLRFREPQTESNGMLLAGDAAGFIDPFAGDGISLALHSGALAAEALLPFLQRESSSLASARRNYRSVYMKHLAPAFRNAARVRAALDAPRFIRSLLLNLAGTKPVGRMLVRSTRARGIG